jgi:phosphoribosylaminoimidazole-succinocarboxamide synthase
MFKKLFKVKRIDINMRKIGEGKTKIIYENGDRYIVEFKNDMTAFDGIKKTSFENKGFYNKEISVKLFKILEENGVKTHFIEDLGEDKIAVKKLKMIPVEVVCRNIAAGSILKRIPIEKGTKLNGVVEFFYKNDELHDPMISEDHIRFFGEDPEKLKEITKKVNKILFEYLEKKGITLVDFKLEFGKFKGEYILGDELSPDSCRFWIKDKSYDKDVFRFDKGDVSEIYKEIYKLICGD